MCYMLWKFCSFLCSTENLKRLTQIPPDFVRSQPRGNEPLENDFGRGGGIIRIVFLSKIISKVSCCLKKKKGKKKKQKGGKWWTTTATTSALTLSPVAWLGATFCGYLSFVSSFQGTLRGSEVEVVAKSFSASYFSQNRTWTNEFVQFCRAEAGVWHPAFSLGRWKTIKL